MGTFWKNFLLFFLGVLLGAFLLDGLFLRGSFLLGLMGVLPVILWREFSFHRACLIAFVLGLLLDGTHYSLPLGFNGFFGLACVFLLHMLFPLLRRDTPQRLLMLSLLLTTIYYIVLSLFAPSFNLALLLIFLPLSLVFNGGVFQLFLHLYARFFQNLRKKS